METGQPCEVESEGVRDDGSVFTVRDRAFPLYKETGELIGFNEVVEDITERKKLEIKLQENQESLSIAQQKAAETGMAETPARDYMQVLFPVNS